MSHVLENDTVQEKQLGSTILRYMAIPYFSNNPWYLTLWKRAYEIKPCSEILFLMHMKGIGVLSSWLYLRLHEHFLSVQCPSCAHTILVEGIKMQAHPIEELEEKIDHTNRTTHKLEKPARIKVFGKEWIHTVVYAHPEEILKKEGPGISCREYRIIQSIRQTKKRNEEETEKGLNEVSLLFGRPRGPRKNIEVEEERDTVKKEKKDSVEVEYSGILEQREIPEVSHRSSVVEERSIEMGYMDRKFHSLNSGKIDRICLREKDASDLIAEESVDNVLAKEEIEAASLNILDKKAQGDIRDVHYTKEEEEAIAYRKRGIQAQNGAFGNIMAGSKVVVMEMLYIIKKQLGGTSFLATRIASLGDGNVTLNAKDYAIRTIDSSAKEYEISKAVEDTGCTVPIEAAIKYSDKLIVLAGYREMGSLDRAITLIGEKVGHTPELLAAHYIKEILVIGESLQKKNYSISGCTLRDFVLVVENGKITLKIADYKNIRQEGAFSIKETEMHRCIMKNVKIENTQNLLTHPLPSAAWIAKIEMYLLEKKESSLLHNLFITQEVCIYEEGHLL